MRRPISRRAAFALPLLLAGCVVEPPNPNPPTPPLQVETVPPPPRPLLVWEPGTWRWTGFQYVWLPGHYIERPPGDHWVHGHWAYRGGNWVWIAGGWY